ncbi:PA-phosphatase, partial [Actinoplanes sp. NPDC048791]
MFSRTRAAAVLAALTLTGPAVLTPTPALAATTPNAVITWNVHAQTAIYEVARQSPNVTGRSFAMVQGAVYDAVNAVAGTPYQPYLIAPRSRRGDSADAAVAGAAYRVLVSLFPAQTAALTAQYDQALAAIP